MRACPRVVGRLVIVLVLLGLAPLSAASAPDGCPAPQSPLDPSDATLGFENTTAWTVDRGLLAGTPVRTQGACALALRHPGEEVELRSDEVASSAAALAGLGDPGSSFAFDVLVPEHHDGDGGDGEEKAGKEERRDWDHDGGDSDRIQVFLSSASRGLDRARLGHASLEHVRRGVYSTLRFAIPHEVRDKLTKGPFDDLVFVIKLRLPEEARDSWTFDNLRVRSATLVTASAGTRPPPGYGGSIDLVVFGGESVEQTFAIGPVQVPRGFHLKLGSARGTLVELQLGLDGAAAVSCAYAPDRSDPSEKSYRLRACSGGVGTGDLVSANWARLAVTGGDSSIKLRAQLAASPVGDLLGAGIIPPMPTYWGDFDDCVPAPVSGTIVTTSDSCAGQIAEASRIVTSYFDEVNRSDAPPNWIVTPAPEFARRHGDGSPHNDLTGPPPPPGDPPLPFDYEGHLNQGGDWDAYWQLNGAADPESIGGTDRTTTSFSASLGTHVVLDGDDVDVASIEVDVDTATTQTIPVPVGPHQTGRAHLFVFGTEFPAGGYTTDLTTFDFEEDHEQDYDLPPVDIWIFSVTLGATAKVGFTAQGGFPPNSSGFNLVFTPQASLGAHLQGSVSIILASGGIDTSVDLLDVSTPVHVNETWAFNFDPAVCAATLTGAQQAQAQIGSLGGEVDLIATFGICPFCKDESWKVFSWDPLPIYTADLFSTPIASSYGLPPALCTQPLTVQIFSPTSGQQFPANLPITLQGAATTPGHFGDLPCGGLTWTFTPANPADTVSPPTATGCSPQVTFAQPASGSSANWTINLGAKETFPNQFETITETGTAAPVSIGVSRLAGGDYITQMTDSNGNVYTPNLYQCGGFTFCIIGNTPLSFTIQGLVTGATGTLSTTFTITDSSNHTTTLVTNNPSSSTPSANWTPPVINGSNQGNFTIKMTTTSGGAQFGTTTATVSFTLLI